MAAGDVRKGRARAVVVGVADFRARLADLRIQGPGSVRETARYACEGAWRAACPDIDLAGRRVQTDRGTGFRDARNADGIRVITRGRRAVDLRGDTDPCFDQDFRCQRVRPRRLLEAVRLR